MEDPNYNHSWLDHLLFELLKSDVCGFAIENYLEVKNCPRGKIAKASQFTHNCPTGQFVTYVVVTNGLVGAI